MHVSEPQTADASSANRSTYDHLHTSIRVQTGGTPPKCLTCGGSIDDGVRYKCVTVRDDSGAIRELPVCGEACLGSIPVAFDD